jgi:predicted ribosomally synthesized peptide with nif11-like leader
MAMDQAAQFYDEIKTNPALRNAVQKIEENVVHIAKSHGYDFTHDELLKCLEQRWGADFEADNESPDEPQTCACI